MSRLDSLRVLQVGMGWFPEQAGGLNRVFFHLTGALPAEGVSVRGVVAAQAPTRGVVSVGARTAPLASRLSGARRSVRGLVEAWSPHVVASHFALYTAPALDAVRGRPLVVHFHGPWAAEGAAEGHSGLVTAAKRLIEGAVYGRADRYVVLSEAFADLLADRYGASPDRICIVPGGVDVARFSGAPPRSAARAALGWSPDRPTILAVRRLAHRMGLERLIDAMSFVRRAVPDALLLIAGTGPLGDALRARVIAGGLDRHVRLLGFLPEEALPLAYRAADVTALPSVALEGFGLTAAESLAAGTPALVTPVGGLPEVVRDLDPGLVLPSTDPAAIASALTEALTGARALPDEAACSRFAARYDWSVVAKRTAEVYEGVR